MTGPRLVVGRAGSFGARKYANQPTTTQGRSFHSKREARRYEQLLLLAQNGELRDLKCQVSFRLEVGRELICKYVADFTYTEFRAGQWSDVVEDVKGYATPVYKLKKRLMKVLKGIDIRET